MCLAVGMSGCDTDADVVLWRGICESVAPNARAIVENDAVMALCSGTGGVLEGVVVISGTGSIAFGAAPGRPRVRVGGWGAKLGDAGNGCSIGQANASPQPAKPRTACRSPNCSLLARAASERGLASVRLAGGAERSDVRV